MPGAGLSIVNNLTHCHKRFAFASISILDGFVNPARRDCVALHPLCQAEASAKADRHCGVPVSPWGIRFGLPAIAVHAGI
jgi:hypothetical protein